MSSLAVTLMVFTYRICVGMTSMMDCYPFPLLSVR